MELDFNIEAMVEKEIERQVEIFVNAKMKELTMKKLNNMGYDLKKMITDCIYEELQSKVNISELYKKVSEEDGLKIVADCLAQELIATIKYC